MYNEMVRRIWFWFGFFLSVAFLLAVFGPGTAHSGEAIGNAEGLVEFAGDIDSEVPPENAGINREIEPFKIFYKAGHVANGVALRNRLSGTIHLRGVPEGRKIQGAYLYYSYLDNTEIGGKSRPVYFNGNRMYSVKVADTAILSSCYTDVIASHTYKANVTRFVDMTGHPNQDYDVDLLHWSINTKGQNPWGSIGPQVAMAQGATLIVIYSDEERGPVYIYDDLYDSLFYGSGAFSLFHYYVNPKAGLFTMVGSDGQRGSGHNNFASNETTTFNGVQIAGPPVAASDWDGSDGWPLPQLWDTHTHEVTIQDNVSKVVYKGGLDCLIPIAFILDV